MEKKRLSLCYLLRELDFTKESLISLVPDDDIFDFRNADKARVTRCDLSDRFFVFTMGHCVNF